MPTPPIYSSPALGYASDADYVVETDAWDNTPVDVEPSPLEITQGMRPQRQVAAQGNNWVMNQFAQIMTQLITDVTTLDGDIVTIDTELANHEGRITTLEGDWANHTPRLRIYGPFLATTTTVWTPNARVVAAWAWGYGGGAGGGSGNIPIADTGVGDVWYAGAGGGGGALPSSVPLVVVPSTSYSVIAGIGGAGSGINGVPGNDGGDSFIKQGSTVLAQWLGAQGGRGTNGTLSNPSSSDTALSGIFHYVWGGAPTRNESRILLGTDTMNTRFDPTFSPFAASQYSYEFPVPPGYGGFGAGGSTHPSASGGQRNIFGGFNGGSAGLFAADSGSARGGGGGGGGAAGPAGPGGNGGDGIDGGQNRSNAPPSDGATGSGAGGGGSGSAAYWLTGFNNPVPDAGGNGGSGAVWIVTVEES
jgi:hypothetical protein